MFSNIDNEFEKNGSLELTNNEANSEIVPKKDDEFDNDEYPDFSAILDDDSCLDQRIVQHKLWLKGIRHEQPSLSRPFKVGIYIRYFNQTRYENYLENHIKQFTDSVALCPNWTLVDFYIDEGQTAPSMENAPEWVRLLGDCFSGKVDLIITQKVSSVSRNPDEITFVSRNDVQRQQLRIRAQKVPKKVKRLSMCLLVCFMLTYVVVILSQIVDSLGTLFA